jgi:hypothetical protein
VTFDEAGFEWLLSGDDAARVNSRGRKPSEFERALVLQAMLGAHLRRLDAGSGLVSWG